MINIFRKTLDEIKNVRVLLFSTKRNLKELNQLKVVKGIPHPLTPPPPPHPHVRYVYCIYIVSMVLRPTLGDWLPFNTERASRLSSHSLICGGRTRVHDFVGPPWLRLRHNGKAVKSSKLHIQDFELKVAFGDCW